MTNSFVTGIDIGGSHITAAVVDMENGTVIPGTWQRKAVQSGGSASEIIEAWCAVIADSFKVPENRPSRIGIAMPGPFDYVEGISLLKDQDKYDALYGMNVKEILSQQLAVAQNDILFENDAACFLRGEVFGGAAKGFHRVLGLTLGTGFGSARYNNGKAEDAGFWCVPFRDGMAEDYLSTRWFRKHYETLSGNAVKDVKAIAERLPDDVHAQATFDEFGATLATFLLSQIEAEQPEVIVVGGNIAKALPHFEKALMTTLEKAGAQVLIKPAILGEDAALIGAASLAE